MKLKSEDKKRIVELKKKGYTFSSIALEFNVVKSVVKLVVKKFEMYGEESFETKLSNHVYTSDKKLEIIKRYYKGETLGSLALIYKILGGAGTIYSWVKKFEKFGYNVLSKKQGRPPNYMKKIEKNTTPEPSESKIIPLSEVEKKRLLELEKENEQLRMENDYLKKLDALVQARLKQEKKKK